MSCPSPGEEPAVKTVIEDKDAAKRYAKSWEKEKHRNTHTWWTDSS